MIYQGLQLIQITDPARWVRCHRGVEGGDGGTEKLRSWGTLFHGASTLQVCLVREYRRKKKKGGGIEHPEDRSVNPTGINVSDSRVHVQNNLAPIS